MPAQAVATLVASDLNKTRKMVAEGTSVVEAVPNPGDASVLSLGIASENGKSTQLVQLTAVGGVEFSQDRVVQVKPVSPFQVCVSCWLSTDIPEPFFAWAGFS